MFSSIIKKNRVNYTLPFIVVFIVSCFKFIYLKKKKPKKTLFWVCMAEKCLIPCAEHI